jgi:EmrB/QacA subfamily drug resistance transporter
MSSPDKSEAVADPEAPWPLPPAGLASGEGRLGLALVVIAAAQLMLVLDTTIMNVALPSIQRALHLGPAELSWLISGYALTFGGLLLAGGRAGDLFGRRRVFRTGLVLFTLASLAGGLAPNSAVLIAARLVQGAGAAIAAPTALSLLATTFPAGPPRNRALGVYGAMGGLGSVVGLLLGGALTEYLSWRWVLFVNVPIALAVLAGTAILEPGGRDQGRIDLPGAITATAGLGSLVYAFSRAGQDGWGNQITIAFLAAAAVLLSVFGAIQRRSVVTLLPPAVLRDRSRAGANLVMLLMGAAMLAMFYFLTLYMQEIRGFSAMRTGLAYLPFTVGIGLTAGGIGPRLLAVTSPRVVTVAGLVLAGGATAWLSLLTPGSGYFGLLFPAMLIGGAGTGLAFVTCTIAGVRGVAPQDTGIASGLINTSSQVGGALGLAGLAAVASAVARHQSPGTPLATALTHGYSAGFAVGVALYLAALVAAALTLGNGPGPDAA